MIAVAVRDLERAPKGDFVCRRGHSQNNGPRPSHQRISHAGALDGLQAQLFLPPVISLAMECP